MKPHRRRSKAGPRHRAVIDAQTAQAAADTATTAGMVWAVLRALGAILWGALRLWENKTVQRLYRRWKRARSKSSSRHK